jgi:hypothetical protein
MSGLFDAMSCLFDALAEEAELSREARQLAAALEQRGVGVLSPEQLPRGLAGVVAAALRVEANGGGVVGRESPLPPAAAAC